MGVLQNYSITSHCLIDIIRRFGLEKLPFVEIGVWHGKNVGAVLNTFPELHYFGVDPYIPYHDIALSRPVKKQTQEEWDQTYEEVRQKLSGYDRFELIRGKSLTAVHRFQDKSLGMVFIDGDHSYQAVCDDILAWTPKIVEGGIVAGHDWFLKTVQEAVEGTIGLTELQIIGMVWYRRVLPSMGGTSGADRKFFHGKLT